MDYQYINRFIIKLKNQQVGTIMFEKCCSISHLKSYSLEHQPKPLIMLPLLRDSIDQLLWYVPGIDSYQSKPNYLIDDVLFSVAIFNEVLESIGLNLEKDVQLIDSASVPEDLVEFYKDSACITCQKVILTKSSKETWIKAFLRHLRNSIAHGRFTTIDNFVIFFDKNNRSEKFTSIIKIDIEKFSKVLFTLKYFRSEIVSSNDFITEQQLISRELVINGFELIHEELNTMMIADLLVSKKNVKYAIDLKYGDYKPIGFSDEHIVKAEKMLQTYKNEGYKIILIYIRGRLTGKAIEYSMDKDFEVYDKLYLEKLFSRDAT